MHDIKEMMKSGDVQGAAAELKKLLAAEPENAEAQMLYGTCCHLLGDDKSFDEIADALAPKMEKEMDERTLVLWGRYRAALAESHENALVCGAQYMRAGMTIAGLLIMVGLVAVALCLIFAVFGKQMFTSDAVVVPEVVPESEVMNLYAGPPLQGNEI